MKPKKKDPVAEELSRQMRALSLRLTPEQRIANSKKAWQTRIKNLQAQIARGNGQ